MTAQGGNAAMGRRLDTLSSNVRRRAHLDLARTGLMRPRLVQERSLQCGGSSVLEMPPRLQEETRLAMEWFLFQ